MAKDQPPDDGAKPWYRNGLSFTCTGCGNCCTGGPGYVWVNNEEIAAIAAYLGITPSECKAQYVTKVGVRKSLVEMGNYDCVFLEGETRHCTVYAVRPRQCRTWPFWQSNLKSPEAWAKTCQVCPGSGSGKLYSLEEVEAQSAVIRL